MAVATTRSDPRRDAPVAADAGVAPIVRVPRQGLPAPLLAVLALVAAIALFLILDSRRRAMSEVEITETGDAFPTAPPPPLYLPESLRAPVAQAQPATIVPVTVAPAPQIRSVPISVPGPAPQIVYVPQPVAEPYAEPSAEPPRVAPDPALVIDSTGASAASSPAAPGAAGEGAPAPREAAQPARARMLTHRSTTVPQGTLIPAVLETGFDSNWPGNARAIVSRDIRGFDGKRVLIPRGSRLFGEYRSEVSQGQNRAMVQWTRLTRPDGASVAIGSPAADSVGRAGIRANVNSHFFERFASSILRSVVDIGVTLAAARSNSSVIVAAPGALQGAGSAIAPQREFTPTLTVKPGTSVSVLVARDLDFAGVERLR